MGRKTKGEKRGVGFNEDLAAFLHSFQTPQGYVSFIAQTQAYDVQHLSCLLSVLLNPKSFLGFCHGSYSLSDLQGQRVSFFLMKEDNLPKKTYKDIGKKTT